MKKRQKHNYTSELELKSLLIRVKNKNSEKGTLKHNRKINKYVKLYVKINALKYPKGKDRVDLITKKNSLKVKLKAKIIELSEGTRIDKDSYENFGAIILLMIKSILTKPNFSGYTYRDDFYSDAVHKILKYLHNFDHTKISERSGTFVNSFAYISQIIHNSVIFIINSKKREQVNIKNQVSTEILNHNLCIKDYESHNTSTYEDTKQVVKVFEYQELEDLIECIKEIREDFTGKVLIKYPKDYRISLEEYDRLKPHLKDTNIERLR